LFFYLIKNFIFSSVYFNHIFSDFFSFLAIEEKKEIEQNIRFENADFSLENVYDTSHFTDLIYRVHSESNNVIENASSERNNKKENEKESRNKDETNVRNEIYPEIKDGFLRVKIPVAEVEGDFRMIPGGTVNEGRECETLVQVLQYGMYQVRTLQYSTVWCSAVCMKFRDL
jgi:hypothetical protein